MPIPVTIPRLGWNMDEGTFVAWLKADSDPVRLGDAVFSLEGEKATEEIESLDAGTLHIPATGPKPGDRLRVGTVIGHRCSPEASPALEPGTIEISRKRYVCRAAARDRLGGSLAVPHVDGPQFPCHHAASAPARSQAGHRLLEARRQRARRPNQGARRRGDCGDCVSFARIAGGSRSPHADPPRDRGQHAQESPDYRTHYAHLRRGRDEPRGTPLPVQGIGRQRAGSVIHRHFREAGRRCAPEASAAGVALDGNRHRSRGPHRHRRRGGYRRGVARSRTARRRPSMPALAKRSRELIERGSAAERFQRGRDSRRLLHHHEPSGRSGIDAFTPIINPRMRRPRHRRIERRPVMDGDRVVGRQLVTLCLTFDHRIVDGAAARFANFAQLVENTEAPPDEMRPRRNGVTRHRRSAGSGRPSPMLRGKRQHRYYTDPFSVTLFRPLGKQPTAALKPTSRMPPISPRQLSKSWRSSRLDILVTTPGEHAGSSRPIDLFPREEWDAFSPWT